MKKSVTAEKKVRLWREGGGVFDEDLIRMGKGGG